MVLLKELKQCVACPGVCEYEPISVFVDGVTPELLQQLSETSCCKMQHLDAMLNSPFTRSVSSTAAWLTSRKETLL